MSTELLVTRQESDATPSQRRPASVPAKKESFSRVVAQVIGDSQQKPAEYLDEVVVLKGGE